MCLHLQDAPQGPHIDFEAVARLTQHLWSDVVRSPTKSLLTLSVKLYFSGQAKVPWRRDGGRSLLKDSRC